MSDVAGSIVLGLDIAKTTSQINADLSSVLAGIGKKEIVLSAKIDNINTGNMTSQIRGVASQMNQEFSSSLNSIVLVNEGIGNLSRMLQGAGFSKGSISTVTQDLQKMSLQISKITTTMSKNGNIQLRIQGIDELQRAVTVVRQYDAETGKVSNASKTFVQSFEQSRTTVDNFAKSLQQAQNALATNKIDASIASVTAKYEQLGSTGHASLAQIQTDIQTLNSLHQAMTNNTNNVDLVRNYEQYEQVLSRVRNSLSLVATETRRAADAQNTMTRSATLSNRMETWMNQNTRAAQRYGEELRRLQGILANNTDRSQLTSASAEFARIQTEAKAAGLTTNQFAQSIKNVAMQLLGLTSPIMVIRKLISVIREGIDTVVELDTALVDLKKTTTMSGSDLTSFYKDANVSAKELGVTTKDIIQTASDWSRLGWLCVA